jgi:uracil-DNA glycosylase family 4
MQVTGNGKKGILIITEFPTQEEDACGKMLSGRAGLRLRVELKHFGIDADQDCWITSAVACSPRNAKVQHTEVQACRPNILQLITTYKPTLVLMFGAAAMSSVVGYSNPKLAYNRMKGFPLLCGKIFPDTTYPGSWLACSYSPSYIVERNFDIALQTSWRNDLQDIFSIAFSGTPKVYTDNYKITTDARQALEWLRKLEHGIKPFAFDYETTGLKPHAIGHKVKSIGFAPSNQCGYSFTLDTTPEWDAVRETWRRILQNPARPKIAHNLPYEWAWSKHCFKVLPQGWAGDTQVLAHLEDSRVGNSGLKAQCYLKFGTPEYTEEVGAFLRASKEDEDAYGCNAINAIDSAPVDELLKYNALDALYTLRLWEWFKERGLATNDGEDYTIHG